MSHWYDRQANSRYTIVGTNGVERSTTLRDARKHGYLPSVTTILGVIDKPNLVDWKVKQAILSSLTLDRYDNESDDDYISRILADSKQQAIDAADEGSRIHDAIECAFKGKPFPAEYRQHVNAVDRELNRLFPHVDDWISEKSFAHHYGFAGRVDLHSPSTGIVVDYKTKNGDFSDGKKLAYDQNIQLGGYRRGLELPDGNVSANIFVSRDVPGAVASHVWSREDVNSGENIFLACLHLWQLIKNYSGAWDVEANHSQLETVA